MKLVVFGATGPSGRAVVRRALAAGHGVRAFVRNPLAADLAGAEVVSGDVLQPESVVRAVTGTDVVISTLGQGSSNKPTTVMSTGTGAILDAMAATGVTRLVCMTSRGGFRDPSEPFAFRVFGRWLYGNIFADHQRVEAKVLQSNVEWTLVRPTSLTNGPHTGRYRADREAARAGWKKMSRADVADFIVNEINTGAYRNAAVCLGGM